VVEGSHRDDDLATSVPAVAITYGLRRRELEPEGESGMSGICEGRVAIVTGAGRGIGREHSLMLAEQGARVVVNDLGGSMDGTGDDEGPAQQVVEEIQALGGEAVANIDDISSWDGAERLVGSAIEHFGRLDVLVNNAGILRDRMLTNMTEQEWDAVIRVHLKGTFAPSRHAAAHWRERSKAGEEVDARIINTSSPSGIYGNVGQTNYGAAKAGIASFTVIAAKELGRYGVTVNAIAPAALTRMTENLGMGQLPEEDKERMSPRYIAPIVVWLASGQSKEVTGRVFDVSGRALSVSEGWHRGPTIEMPDDDPAALGDDIRRIVSEARPNANMMGLDEA
jgi:NAD(P)-dependent dehydrogenase (short-subunit alcohol dehydrogenase family)